MKKWAVLAVALLFGAGLVGASSPADAELQVAVSGYVKLDIQYTDKITGQFPSFAPGDVPLDPSSKATAAENAVRREKDNGQTILDVRQTRVRVNATDEVAGVKLRSSVETDFFTGDGNALVSNSRHLRLRHAFMRGDHPSGFFILAGQYWGLLMNIDVAQPNLVDFNGPSGQIFLRQPQLKVGYKTPLGNGMGDLIFEAGVEKHSLSDLGATSVNEAQGAGQDLPLFGGKVSWWHPIFKVEAAGQVGQNTVILAGGKDEDDTAFAFQVSAEVNLAPVTLFGHFQHLDGLGRLGLNDLGSQVVLFNNEVENIESNGFYVGASLALTKETSVNGVFGWNQLDEEKQFGITGGVVEEQQSIHVNILHKFWKRWQAGIEYRRIDIETFDGQEGDVNSVHGALWFFF